jgi:hypothetical protein
MTNPTEFYTLNGTAQSNFTGFKGKRLRYVLNRNHDQYFFASKDYDRDFDIEKTG